MPAKLAKAADVVLVAERHGLHVHDFALGIVVGTLHHLKEPEQRHYEQQAAGDRQPGQRVRTWMEYLSHARDVCSRSERFLKKAALKSRLYRQRCSCDIEIRCPELAINSSQPPFDVDQGCDRKAFCVGVGCVFAKLPSLVASSATLVRVEDGAATRQSATRAQDGIQPTASGGNRYVVLLLFAVGNDDALRMAADRANPTPSANSVGRMPITTTGWQLATRSASVEQALPHDGTEDALAGTCEPNGSAAMRA